MIKNDISPLLELRLELVGPEILFTPSVGGVHGNELRSTVLSWVHDFLNVAKFVARLDTTEGDYLYEIDEDISIIKKVQELNSPLDGPNVDAKSSRRVREIPVPLGQGHHGDLRRISLAFPCQRCGTGGG